MEVKLSASRIKTAQSCSWLYWSKYIQHLPDTNNDGARRGSICHNVFEHLAKQNTKKAFNKIVKEQDPFADKTVKDMMLSEASAEGIDDDSNMTLMKEMILNGLDCNFHGEDLGIPTESYAELEFDIEKNGYRIRGYIDQLFLYKEKKVALVRDFKTSKKIFEGKEKEDNLQDYIYCLAVKHLFPEYVNRNAEFLFLKFNLKKEGLLKMKPLDEDDLEGFELQLANIQEYLENFDEVDAHSNFAHDRGFPDDGSFGGRLQCGFAKEKGQLKKDGSVMWHCPYKFDFWYVTILNKEGEFHASCFQDEFDKSMVPEGGSHSIKYYKGCPKHL
jgi:hypothetical protein|tara:strand:+ start:552 stop:1541 length:990 start_codon:yes stop_codon:yes gene_type:complete